MKHKPETWNGATPSATSSDSSGSVRRSLTRAGLGQLSHVVSGALNTLQGGGGSNPRGAAQNRMRALLSQDRALLSHRACGQASLVDEPDAPQIPVKGSQTRGAAQNRMRELLHQDRALLALREAKGLERAELDADEDFYNRFEQPERASEPSVGVVAAEPATASVAESSVPRATCLGVTTCFVAEPAVATVCTPGPMPASMPVQTAAAPIFKPPVVVAVAAGPRPSVAPAADASASAEPAPDPIRTRGMAKLLALQGYKDRALSIYDELLAVEPSNAELRAEADRLRN